MTQAVKQAVSTAFTRFSLIKGMQQAASAMQGLDSWDVPLPAAPVHLQRCAQRNGQGMRQVTSAALDLEL